MSLSTDNRRVSVAALAGVDRQGCISLGGGGPVLGLQDSLSCGPHTVQASHPLPFIQPLVHQGQSSGCGSALSRQEGSNGSYSSSISRVLQPIVHGDEGLRVLEAGHRPFSAESEGAQDILQDGDSSVCASLSSVRRLDGVSGLEGCLLAGPDSSGQPQVSQIRSFWPGVPVQGAVLWSLHGSSGLYQSHGSGFDLSTPCKYPHPSLPGRLADTDGFSFSGSASIGCGSSIVSFSGDRRQLGGVTSGACAEDDTSWRSSVLGVFQGFACPEERYILAFFSTRCLSGLRLPRRE